MILTIQSLSSNDNSSDTVVFDNVFKNVPANSKFGVVASLISGNSHAEGYGTNINNSFASHAEGYGTNINNSFASHAEGDSNNISGDYSHAEGIKNILIGNGSHAEGDSNNISGNYSHAEGCHNAISGGYSHAEGSNTNISSYYSHAEGYNTSVAAIASHAEGHSTSANHGYSHSEGSSTITGRAYQHVSGLYNSIKANAILVVGCGTSTSNRKNAMWISDNTSNSSYISTGWQSTSADYAEYFEWEDGNVETEDRTGFVVSLTESGKIKKCEETETPIGIISATAFIIGDSPEDYWTDKYLTDKFGRQLYEEKEILIDDFDEEGNPIQRTKVIMDNKINPDFKEDVEYIPRSKRPEWAVVGLLGKIRTLHDGTVKPGDYCKLSSNPGILTKSETPTQLRAIKKITDDVVLVFIK